MLPKLYSTNVFKTIRKTLVQNQKNSRLQSFSVFLWRNKIDPVVSFVILILFLFIPRNKKKMSRVTAENTQRLQIKNSKQSQFLIPEGY